jgi:WS/DGAT/MGAT family acyltransferase
MPALSSIDLAMFLLESRERPFNIGPLVLLRPPPGFKGSFADKLHAKLLQRTPGPPFNYRLVLSLTRAPAVEPMADADIREHVHRLTLKQATLEQLFDEVCALHETLLDRSGLLWQFYVIDGLADGRVALYGKVHHGIIDGRAFVKAVTQWFSENPKDREVRAMWDGVRRPGGGAKRAGLVQSLRDTGARATGLLRTAADMTGLLAEQGLRSAGLGKGVRLPYLQVPEAFDGKLSARRTYAYCTLPLAEMKAIGKAQHATVNDLLLTVLDMAMQRYLAEEGKTPDTPLVADMPVALAADAKGGNQIAVLQFPLGRAAAGVAERLAAIRRETGRLKAALGARGSDTVMLYTTLVHALELLAERVATSAMPRLANVMVSNPYGLEAERYLMGATVELALPMSVVATGHKLNITAVTVGPRLQLGFLAMPEAMPQVGKLARYTEQAFDEMARALGPPPPRAGAAAKKATPRHAAAPRRVAAKTASRTPAKTASRNTKQGAKA